MTIWRIVCSFRKKVHVEFGREYTKPKSPYVAICVKVRKRDNEAFLRALSKLSAKCALCGCKDYDDVVNEIIPKLTKSGRK